MTTEPLTPDAVRVLIAEAEESLALVGDGDWTPQDNLLRRATTALSASLPREAACRDAEPTPDELFALALDGGGSRGDALVRLWRAGRDSILARVRAAEAERDEARATATRLNRRAQEAESKVARSEALAARVGSIEQVRKFLADQGVDGLQELADRSRASQTTPAHCPSCDGYQTAVMDDGQRSVGPCEGVEARTVETAEEWEYGVARDGAYWGRAHDPADARVLASYWTEVQPDSTWSPVRRPIGPGWEPVPLIPEEPKQRGGRIIVCTVDMDSNPEAPATPEDADRA